MNPALDTLDDRLVNDGILYLNCDGSANREIRCAVVVGSARGGTSLAAGVMHHLGIFMGRRATAPVYEDVYLSKALESGRTGKARKIIQSYSSEHEIWGFKRPGLIHYFGRVESLFPPGRYIVMFKDLISIVNRNRISVGSDVRKALDRAINDNRRLIECVNATQMPLMLCSYEKVVSKPDRFVDALIDYLRIKPSPQARRKAINFIQRDPPRYIDGTRTNKSVGNLDRVEGSRVSGWAKYLHRNKPPTVELLVNGELIDRTVAEIYRRDVLEAGKHPTGKCGFKFELDNPLSESDLVSVKVLDDVYEFGRVYV